MVEPALATAETKDQSKATSGGEGGTPKPTAEQQVETGGDGSPQPKPKGEGSDPNEQPKPKIEGEGEGEGGQEKPAEEPKPKAPERYEFTAEIEGMPKGQKLDDATLKKWGDKARELDLDNDQAQSVLKAVVPEVVRQYQEHNAAIQKGWVEAQRADKEIGGDKLTGAIADALEVLRDDRIATPALRELFNGPLGDHPEIIRLFSRLKKVVREDPIVTDGNGGGVDPEAAEEARRRRVLYSKTPQ